MSLDERLLTVIHALYDAAVDETRWPDALQQLTELTGSQAATFWVLDGADEPRLPTFVTYNFDPAFIGEYLDGMAPHDPTVQYLVAHPKAAIVHDGLVMSERDKDRHRYYDWHGGHSDTRFRMVGQVSPGQEIQAGVALHRTRTAGRYEPADLERFALLHRHLERALTIGLRLGSLGSLQPCTTELLDRAHAAILLDRRGRVVYANRRVAALAAERDGIDRSGLGIALAHRADHDRLQALIGGVLQAAASGQVSPGGAMRVARPSGKRPYGLVVSPLAAHAATRMATTAIRPAACVVITDPDGPFPVSTGRLRGAFGLTEAEGDLAARLANGEELRSAAAALDITYGTARARLAEIFEKTGTHRQGELVALLLRTLAGGLG